MLMGTAVGQVLCPCCGEAVGLMFAVTSVLRAPRKGWMPGADEFLAVPQPVVWIQE